MKSWAFVMLLLAAPAAFADCVPPAALALAGTETIAGCDRTTQDCVFATTAQRDYVASAPDDPSRLAIWLQSSPWRLYGPDLRIVTPTELAVQMRPHVGTKVKAIDLIGSWTGVAVATGTPSLAAQLSAELGGIPVSGMDGFLWIGEDGTRRTSRHAITVRAGSGIYQVPRGGELMSALLVGWASMMEDRIAASGDGEMLLHAGVGWDAFFLCPGHALATFEAAAGLGNAIAAYNAATIRLERDAAGDRDAALVLLQRAAALGDAMSVERLQELQPAR